MVYMGFVPVAASFKTSHTVDTNILVPETSLVPQSLRWGEPRIFSHERDVY